MAVPGTAKSQDVEDSKVVNSDFTNSEAIKAEALEQSKGKRPTGSAQLKTHAYTDEDTKILTKEVLDKALDLLKSAKDKGKDYIYSQSDDAIRYETAVFPSLAKPGQGLYINVISSSKNPKDIIEFTFGYVKLSNEHRDVVLVSEGSSVGNSVTLNKQGELMIFPGATSPASLMNDMNNAVTPLKVK